MTAAAIGLAAVFALRWLRTDLLPGRLWSGALRAERAGRWDEALDRYERFLARYPDDPRVQADMLRHVLGCLRRNSALEQPRFADTAELYLMFHRGGFEEGERRMRANALAILLHGAASERELLGLAFAFRRGRWAQPPSGPSGPWRRTYAIIGP